MKYHHGSELTLSEVNDLAHHFLGREWYASTWEGAPPDEGKCQLTQGGANGCVGSVFYGRTWRDAFRAAGVKLPYRKQFVAIAARVVLDDDTWATAKSNTAAERIANALNAYTPDRRGK